MNRPNISNDAAVIQAGMTIGTYLSQAIAEIDKRLGENYARENPALIAECVRSQTMDFNATALASVLYEIRDTLLQDCGATDSAGRHARDVLKDVHEISLADEDHSVLLNRIQRRIEQFNEEVRDG